MLPLSRPPLAPSTQTALDAMCASHAKDGSPAWQSFRSNDVRVEWQVFAVVWDTLRAMTAQKCALCESPDPKTVEHVAPKAAQKTLVFAWSNLLPACDHCNAARMRNGKRVTSPAVLDPSAPPQDLLDVLGWTEQGSFVANPAFATLVSDTVIAYGLDRFNADRARHLSGVEELLCRVVREPLLTVKTREALVAHLDASVSWLGPVRDYLLHPRTDQHRKLIRVAFRKQPLLQTLVAPWLRPPPGLLPPWLP